MKFIIVYLIVIINSLKFIDSEFYYNELDLIPHNSSVSCPYINNFEKLVEVTCIVYPYADRDHPYISIKATNLYEKSVSYFNSNNLTIKLNPKQPNIPRFITYQNPLDLTYANKLIGIALDGIPIYSALQSNGGNIFENGIGVNSNIRVDHCGGSYGFTNDGIRYHYRVMPTCIINKHDITTRRSLFINELSDLLVYFYDYLGPQLLGYTISGYPIYSPYDLNGKMQSQLDNCNGKYFNNSYGYFVTSIFPYIYGCEGPGVYSSKDINIPQKSLTKSFTTCPQGFYKPFGSRTNGCTPCPAGKYASILLDNTKTNPCIYQPEKGYYSPAGSIQQTKCPPGRFGDLIGLTSYNCSGLCERGHFCTLGSISSTQYECGNYSYYCPVGSADRILVSEGYYSTPEHVPVSNRHSQAICEPGYWCHKGKRYPCPPGRYGDSYGLTNDSCTSTCILGHYCPLGSPLPIKCPSGRYSNTTTSSTNDCSGLCNKGHFCLSGSTSSTMYRCRGGIAGISNGLKTSDCSLDCESLSNTNITDINCIINYCESGYYCPEASVSVTQHECGSPNFFCPLGSVYPTTVSNGYYSIGLYSLPLRLQSDVDATTRFDQRMCEPGYYCTLGVKYKCPKSYYGSQYGLNSSYCNGLCDPGYICDEASTSAQQRLCGDGPQVYCPLGSFNYTIVPSGYYSINGTLTTRSAIEKCPPGMWCQDGINRFCSKGRYSSAGSDTSDCDGLCSPGYYCSEGSSRQFPCPAGRYGLTGQGDDKCSGNCYEGYYCPDNSTSPYQKQCGSDYYYCPTGSAFPLPVSIYYYSIGGTSLTRTGQNKCIFNETLGSPPEGDFRINTCPSNTRLP